MPKLTEQQKAQLDALAAMQDDQIDTSDIPSKPIDWPESPARPALPASKAGNYAQSGRIRHRLVQKQYPRQ